MSAWKKIGLAAVMGSAVLGITGCVPEQNGNAPPPPPAAKAPETPSLQPVAILEHNDFRTSYNLRVYEIPVASSQQTNILALYNSNGIQHTFTVSKGSAPAQNSQGKIIIKEKAFLDRENSRTQVSVFEYRLNCAPDQLLIVAQESDGKSQALLLKSSQQQANYQSSDSVVLTAQSVANKENGDYKNLYIFEYRPAGAHDQNIVIAQTAQDLQMVAVDVDPGMTNALLPHNEKLDPVSVLKSDELYDAQVFSYKPYFSPSVRLTLMEDKSGNIQVSVQKADVSAPPSQTAQSEAAARKYNTDPVKEAPKLTPGS